MTIKKKYIAISVCLLVLCVAGVTYAFKRSNDASPAYATTGDATEKGLTKKNTSVNDGAQNTTDNGSSNQGTNSVAVGTIDQPAHDADYPITNDHYRIDKTGDKTFDIALYAIINSPSQHDEYIQQLKQYKQEALAYLASRYGTTSGLVINWDPPAAKDL